MILLFSAMRLWVIIYLIMKLSCVICKMGIIPTPTSVIRIKSTYIYESSWHESGINAR